MFLMRARALWRADVVDRGLAEEMRAHLEQLTQEHVARGMTPQAAREAARLAFGPVTQLVEESRDARGIMWIANGWQDMRYGVRLMPELYAHLNPMPFEAATEMEKDLAGDLRNEGYTVAGGT